jgi:CRISPR type IV-associated protein Csf1
MMQNITSSVVVAKALGLAPDGAAAREACSCAMCGLAIEVGDLSAPLALGPSFMDDLSLANRGSQMMCGYCAQLVTVKNLMASGFGAFGKNARPFRKWADIAASLIDPPEPPFVMVYATANNQHMAWRAPVNFSREAYRVRVGLRDVLIRRDVLRRAVEQCRVLGEALGYSVAGKKTLPHPFAMLTNDLKSVEHGRLRRLDKARMEAAGPHAAEALKFVRELTLGETWALRFVLTPDAGKP